jgi:type IV pilus assembly protein PilC
MSSYNYVAIDPRGVEMRGMLEVADQSEALKRIKEMGLYPTRVLEARAERRARARKDQTGRKSALFSSLDVPFFGGRVKPLALGVFTRQLATLVEAGMPLLKGLKLLEEQEENRTLKSAIGGMADAIESGGSCAEAVALYPKIFSPLYVNMVRAGEISGALDVTLERLAAFQEKARKIKGKVKSAMFYPCAVMTVAIGIIALLMVFIVPRFKLVFEGLMNGRPMPAFSIFVFRLSEIATRHSIAALVLLAVIVALFAAMLQTKFGRLSFDYLKLKMPVLGPLFRKASISRFARTFGTLIGNGVPILQALNIVKETAGNLVIASVVSSLHENVKQGDPLAPTLKCSGVFPLIVAGMVDVGEQTGSLPEMLAKIADNYDDEVDNAASAMTSLLEPVMIVFLAVVVGSIVIAMFLPILKIVQDGFDGNGPGDP